MLPTATTTQNATYTDEDGWQLVTVTDRLVRLNQRQLQVVAS